MLSTIFDSALADVQLQISWMPPSTWESESEELAYRLRIEIFDEDRVTVKYRRAETVKQTQVIREIEEKGPRAQGDFVQANLKACIAADSEDGVFWSRCSPWVVGTALLPEASIGSVPGEPENLIIEFLEY